MRNRHGLSLGLVLAVVAAAPVLHAAAAEPSDVALTVLESTMWPVPAGGEGRNLSILARNLTNKLVTYPGAKVRYFDSTGVALGDASVSGPVRRLYPQEFVGFTAVAPAGAASFTILAASGTDVLATSGPYYPNRNFTARSPTFSAPDADGQQTVSAEVTNLNDTVTQSVTVLVVCHPGGKGGGVYVTGPSRFLGNTLAAAETQTVSWQTPPEQPTCGTPTLVYGDGLTEPGHRIGPPLPPRSVTLQAASASSISVIWSVPLASAPPAPPITGYTAVASPGGAKCSVPTPRGCMLTGLNAGTTYSVVVRATNAKGSSDASTAVEVRTKLGSKLTVNASPEPIKKSKTLTIAGALTLGGTAAKKGTAVALYFAPKDKAYAKVASTTTGTGGKYTFSRKATATGTWQVRYAETATTEGATASDAVSVS